MGKEKSYTEQREELAKEYKEKDRDYKQYDSDIDFAKNQQERDYWTQKSNTAYEERDKADLKLAEFDQKYSKDLARERQENNKEECQQEQDDYSK